MTRCWEEAAEGETKLLKISKQPLKQTPSSRETHRAQTQETHKTRSPLGPPFHSHARRHVTEQLMLKMKTGVFPGNFITEVYITERGLHAAANNLGEQNTKEAMRPLRFPHRGTEVQLLRPGKTLSTNMSTCHESKWRTALDGSTHGTCSRLHKHVVTLNTH